MRVVWVGSMFPKAPVCFLGGLFFPFPFPLTAARCCFWFLCQSGSPIFPGRDETQLQTIFNFCGTPNEKNWPGVERLENYAILVKPMTFKPPQLVKRLKERFPALS